MGTGAPTSIQPGSSSPRPPVPRGGARVGDEQGWGVINWLVCSDCITQTVGVMGPCGTTLLKPGSILRNSAQLPASGTLPGGRRHGFWWSARPSGFDQNRDWKTDDSRGSGSLSKPSLSQLPALPRGAPDLPGPRPWVSQILSYLSLGRCRGVRMGGTPCSVEPALHPSSWWPKGPAGDGEALAPKQEIQILVQVHDP